MTEKEFDQQLKSNLGSSSGAIIIPTGCQICNSTSGVPIEFDEIPQQFRG